MTNSKGKRTNAWAVNSSFPFTGTQCVTEVDKMFQWLWDNYSDILEEYPNFAKAKAVLGGWR